MRLDRQSILFLGMYDRLLSMYTTTSINGPVSFPLFFFFRDNTNTVERNSTFQFCENTSWSRIALPHVKLAVIFVLIDLLIVG